MSLSDESAVNATNGKHPPTPFNIDGEPIIYDGNPAHVEGILHELSEWTARTGHYVTLLENNAVLLANGKMAVDSIAAVGRARGRGRECVRVQQSEVWVTAHTGF